MTSNYNTSDPILGTVDLDEVFITDAWLIDQYVGNRLFTWGIGGNNILVGYGMLGVSDLVNRSSPTQVGSLTNWKQISVGIQQVGAIKTDGTLWMWGHNDRGCLGDNSALVNRSSPFQIGALTNWKQISATSGIIGMSAAIKTDGTLWVWGSSGSGQLGTSSLVHRSSPFQLGALTNWKQVSLGNQICASVKTDGTLWTWGANDYGQLGLNDVTFRSSPTQVGSLTNWKQVSCSVGDDVTAAIKTDGTLWIWGRNDYGQLGTNTAAGTHRSSPTQVGSLTNWKQVSTSANHTSAIKNDGTLWTWGQNNNGDLGIGDLVHRSSPTQVGSLTNWKQVSAGGPGSSAITYADIT